MTDVTANLALPELIAAQAQKHVTVNEALRALDALVQLAVLDRDLTAPPSGPAEGARWIVAAGATDDWDGHDGEVAAWQDGGWSFYPPQTGWLCYVVDEGALVAWTGAAWADAIFTPTALNNMALFGVGAAADATNPFSAKLNNALWAARTVAEGGDGTLRYKMSKESADKTLSLLFQDDFSGRAEIGLTGDDDFHFKVSADGTTWVDALKIAAADGALSFPARGTDVRQRLTAARTYYVDASLGDDGNDGLTTGSGGAFATLQHALDVVFGTLDLGGNDVTIQLADGSYAKAAQSAPQIGAGTVTIQGNVSTPANVVVGAGAAGPALFVENGATLNLNGFEVAASTGALIAASRNGKILFANLRIGDGTGGQLRAEDGGAIKCMGDYSIVGGGATAQAHWVATGNGIVRVQNVTVTLTAMKAFSPAFAFATMGGAIFGNGCTFVGSATGQQYEVDSNGVLQIAGLTLPGDAAGVTTTGGQVV